MLEQLMNVEFTGYVALTFLLYAIRRASRVSNRYIPLVAVVLGIGFAAFKLKGLNFDVLMQGLKYALYSVGTLAGVKYSREGRNKSGKSQLMSEIKLLVDTIRGKGRKKKSNGNNQNNVEPQDPNPNETNSNQNGNSNGSQNNEENPSNKSNNQDRELPVSGEADI
ncbi:phage holin family protein [Salinibacillus xinjiangensis]|uniref:phage holin family protein n=1 Tax=Salinibacillus xinjiangensis TaxID=1229268 RepID=UPI00189105BF|nr:phage holin family protein [Salinibacillus xinjiangensis]